jgi:hypothetical protein
MQAFPFIIFAVTLAGSWLATEIGVYFHKRKGNPSESAREDLGRVLTATLTLLGLIVGFSFSMAVSEYEQRINAEAAEANAIGTAYLRAGLLPGDVAGRIRKLLVEYLDQRVLFYTNLSYPTGRQPRPAQISDPSTRLQSDLWSCVESVAATTPTPVVALAVAGLNDVFDTQGLARAAMRRRIPIAGWALLQVINVFANALFGYITLSNRMRSKRFWILPLLASISFFFVADMDNPRGGFITTVPHNLLSLSSSVR